jgi:hypothetical protein
MKRYLVGGSVRDALLGLPVSDRDWVVVGATPQQLLDALPSTEPPSRTSPSPPASLPNFPHVLQFVLRGWYPAMDRYGGGRVR